MANRRQSPLAKNRFALPAHDPVPATGTAPVGTTGSESFVRPGTCFFWWVNRPTCFRRSAIAFRMCLSRKPCRNHFEFRTDEFRTETITSDSGLFCERSLTKESLSR